MAGRVLLLQCRRRRGERRDPRAARRRSPEQYAAPAAAARGAGSASAALRAPRVADWMPMARRCRSAGVPRACGSCGPAAICRRRSATSCSGSAIHTDAAGLLDLQAMAAAFDLAHLQARRRSSIRRSCMAGRSERHGAGCRMRASDGSAGGCLRSRRRSWRHAVRRCRAAEPRAAADAVALAAGRLRRAARADRRRPPPRWPQRPRRCSARRSLPPRPTHVPRAVGGRRSRDRSQGTGTVQAAARGADRHGSTGPSSPRCCTLMRAVAGASSASRDSRNIASMLGIHNSLTGKLETFEPLVPGQVRMYVCGITVYDYLPRRPHAHDGRVRRRAALSALQRLRASLTCATSPTSTTRSSGAPREQRRADRGAHRTLHRARWTRTSRALGIDAPDHEPRATALRAADRRDDRQADRARPCLCRRQWRRDVFGLELSGLRPAVRQEAGRSARRRARRRRRSQARSARLRAVEAREARRAELGLAVGRRAGRAGTSNARPCRRRCSATHFDIHGGGMDLKFPHHENEIAQSCGASGAAVRAALDAQRFRAASTTRRCRSRSAISSPCAKCCRICGIPRCCATSCSRATIAARSTTRRTACAGRCHARRLLPRAARARRRRRGRAGATLAREFRAAMDDDFNTPEGTRRAADAGARDQRRQGREARDRGRARSPPSCASWPACWAC